MSGAAIWEQITLHGENTETVSFRNTKIYFEKTVGLLTYQVEQIKTVKDRKSVV